MGLCFVGLFHVVTVCMKCPHKSFGPGPSCQQTRRVGLYVSDNVLLQCRVVLITPTKVHEPTGLVLSVHSSAWLHMFSVSMSSASLVIVREVGLRMTLFCVSPGLCSIELF